MNRSRIRSIWDDRSALGEFTTGVSLHGHTFYSKEMLAIVLRLLRKAGLRNPKLGEAGPNGREVDARRLWWTPPLGPREAWLLEKNQIERFGLQAMVSLTDHDNIEAPMLLRVLDESRDVPVSLEWTAPFRGTFFHIGVHNLNWKSARTVFADLREYSAVPHEPRLADLLDGLNDDPNVLVVLNHPLWDEKGIGKSAHRAVVEALIRRHRDWIHALEINGFRRSKENRGVEQLAAAFNLPVISGGDRHGHEPNANINLTNAASFAEFVAEVREEGRSEVLWMPQQRDRFELRVFRAVCDAVRDDPQHGQGWTHWNDRVFYRDSDGQARPVSAVWNEGRGPRIVNRLIESIQALERLTEHPRLRSASRWQGPGEQETGV